MTLRPEEDRHLVQGGGDLGGAAAGVRLVGEVVLPGVAGREPDRRGGAGAGGGDRRDQVVRAVEVLGAGGGVGLLLGGVGEVERADDRRAGAGGVGGGPVRVRQQL